MNQSISKPKGKKFARDIRTEATKIANSIKVEGQSKAESAAIARGVERGMEQFLRQQSEKTRELDKRVKKAKQLVNSAISPRNMAVAPPLEVSSRLPWALLVLSWILFLVAAGYCWLPPCPH